MTLAELSIALLISAAIVGVLTTAHLLRDAVRLFRRADVRRVLASHDARLVYFWVFWALLMVGLIYGSGLLRSTPLIADPPKPEPAHQLY